MPQPFDIPEKIGVMICGHGSRSQAAVDEFAVLARRAAGASAPRLAGGIRLSGIRQPGDP